MLEHYEQRLEQWISEIVVTGDDDALFASGYLQGHFAVVLSELEVEDDHSLVALEAKMQDCLKLAAKELEDHDYRLVADAWQSLHAKLA
ncbi:YfcL family protein [Shewanella sp.]|uniref:YfcL family protein n=1 Tax=Shewanella sp. TaxID=50422 RepID=UPI003A97B0CD